MGAEWQAVITQAGFGLAGVVGMALLVKGMIGTRQEVQAVEKRVADARERTARAEQQADAMIPAVRELTTAVDTIARETAAQGSTLRQIATSVDALTRQTDQRRT